MILWDTPYTPYRLILRYRLRLNRYRPFLINIDSLLCTALNVRWLMASRSLPSIERLPGMMVRRLDLQLGEYIYLFRYGALKCRILDRM